MWMSYAHTQSIPSRLLYLSFSVSLPTLLTSVYSCCSLSVTDIYAESINYRQVAVMASRVRASECGSIPTRAPPRGMPAITSARARAALPRATLGHTNLPRTLDAQGRCAYVLSGSPSFYYLLHDPYASLTFSTLSRTPWKDASVVLAESPTF